MFKQALLFLAILTFLAPPQTAEAQSRKFSIEKNSQIEKLSHRKKYRFSKSPEIVRRGEVAQRFEIRHGDCGKTSGYSDCANDRMRVEMKEKPKNKFSRPGRGVWYGYSVFIPQSFVSLGKANTALSQVKTEKWPMPMWMLTFNDNPYLLWADNKTCKIGSMASWKGKWNDLVVYANYGQSGADTYFLLYRNDRLICRRNTPFVPAKAAKNGLKLGMKYGVYNSFVSRYLAKNAKKNVSSAALQQANKNGVVSRSPSLTPFKHDWGVKLPTHVVYYDEMRFGSSRETVDVRMLEKAGIPPVD